MDTYVTLSFRHYNISTNLNGVAEYLIGTHIEMPTATSSALPSIIPLTFKFSCSCDNAFKSILEQQH